MTPEEGQKAVEEVKYEYNERVLEFLSGIAKQLVEDEWVHVKGPYEMSDDVFRWNVTAVRPGCDYDDESNMVDFQFEIAEAASFDGEPYDGLNFGFMIVEWGGRELAGIQPYNFTSEVWVHATDADAVEQRFYAVVDWQSPWAWVELANQNNH